MKKILVLGLVALGVGYEASAQAEMTAVTLSQTHDARGSARYQALSGAMGAVGVDFSSVQQNPAGITLFRSGSKISLTGSQGFWQGESNWGTDIVKGKSQGFSFDELSYMTSWQTASGKSVTIGFGILNNGRTRRIVDARGSHSGLKGFSIADYASALLNSNSNTFDGNPTYRNGAPWLGVIGAQTGWLSYDATAEGYQSNYAFLGSDGVISNEGPQSAGLYTEERGYNTNYDFAVGLQLNSGFSLGFSLAATNLSYQYFSSYSEGFHPTTIGNGYYGLELNNSYEIGGFGWRLGMGLLFEPTDGLRLGASVYTPHFYMLRHRKYTSESSARFPDYSSGSTTPGVAGTSYPTPYSEIDFRLSTPWRFGLSGAYVIDRTAIISADYEYSKLGDTRLRDTADDYYYNDANRYDGDNAAIKEDFKGQHTLRLGVELNASRRLALRAGYRFTSQADTDRGINQDIPEKELYVENTAPHYRLAGALSSYSIGLGYRLSPRWTLDATYVFSSQTDKIYAFPFIKDNKIQHDVRPTMGAIKDKQTNSRLVATLSYRF